MYRLVIPFPLKATPRERISKNGGRYKDPAYVKYYAALCDEVVRQIRVSEPLGYELYCGIFNGFTGKQNKIDGSDIDNIMKGVFDSLVYTERMIRDSRTTLVGVKFRAYKTSQPANIVLLSHIIDEDLIDSMIKEYRVKVQLGIQVI